MDLSVIVEERRTGVFSVRPKGQLDSNTSDEFKDTVDSILKSGAKVIIFDLEDLEYISSAGLQVFFGTKRAMNESGGKVLFLNLKPPIRKVFDIIKALPAMSIFKSTAELDEYLQSMQEKASGERDED